MTVSVHELDKFDDIRAVLEKFAGTFPSRQFVFRGQSDSGWTLQTTLDRQTGLGLRRYRDEYLLQKVNEFQSGVNKLADQPKISKNLEWMEYGRHHGLATPLIDFSWSPYIALFFAFDGMSSVLNEGRKVAVYALSLDQLARERAKLSATNEDDYAKAISGFLYEGERRLERSFPVDDLVFIRHPGVHTRRMHAQMGTFLYSTLDLTPHGNSLEGYFDSLEEGGDLTFPSPIHPHSGEPVLHKIIMPASLAKEIFSKLELMGVTGASLYLSPEGVARDIANSVFYERRSALLRSERP